MFQDSGGELSWWQVVLIHKYATSCRRRVVRGWIVSAIVDSEHILGFFCVPTTEPGCALCRVISTFLAFYSPKFWLRGSRILLLLQKHGMRPRSLGSKCFICYMGWLGGSLQPYNRTWISKVWWLNSSTYFFKTSLVRIFIFAPKTFTTRHVWSVVVNVLQN